MLHPFPQEWKKSYLSALISNFFVLIVVLIMMLLKIYQSKFSLFDLYGTYFNVLFFLVLNPVLRAEKINGGYSATKYRSGIIYGIYSFVVYGCPIRFLFYFFSTYLFNLFTTTNGNNIGFLNNVAQYFVYPLRQFNINNAILIAVFFLFFLYSFYFNNEISVKAYNKKLDNRGFDELKKAQEELEKNRRVVYDGTCVPKSYNNPLRKNATNSNGGVSNNDHSAKQKENTPQNKFVDIRRGKRKSFK